MLLICMPEQQCYIFSECILNPYVSCISRPQKNGTIHCIFQGLSGAALLAWQNKLLVDVERRDVEVLFGSCVVWQENDS
jgi:hypothetical protein